MTVGKIEVGESTEPEKKIAEGAATHEPPLEFELLEPEERFTDGGKNLSRVVYRTRTGRVIEEHAEEIRPGVWQKVGEVEIEKTEEPLVGLRGEEQRIVSFLELTPDGKGRHRVSRIEEKHNDRWVPLLGTAMDMGKE